MNLSCDANVCQEQQILEHERIAAEATAGAIEAQTEEDRLQREIDNLRSEIRSLRRVSLPLDMPKLPTPLPRPEEDFEQYNRVRHQSIDIGPLPERVRREQTLTIEFDVPEKESGVSEKRPSVEPEDYEKYSRARHQSIDIGPLPERVRREETYTIEFEVPAKVEPATKLPPKEEEDYEKYGRARHQSIDIGPLPDRVRREETYTIEFEVPAKVERPTKPPTKVEEEDFEKYGRARHQSIDIGPPPERVRREQTYMIEFEVPAKAEPSMKPLSPVDEEDYDKYSRARHQLCKVQPHSSPINRHRSLS